LVFPSVARLSGANDSSAATLTWKASAIAVISTYALDKRRSLKNTSAQLL
jgi:hypothetical protein